jgi:short-subunit dehydrogenase
MAEVIQRWVPKDKYFHDRVREYELRDTGVSVTALQPGPTDTDFFHRAGMDNTEIGTEGKHQSQPQDVAKEGIEALLSGKDQVYSAFIWTKMDGTG